MSDSSRFIGAQANDAVEALLKSATPRLTPPHEDERIVRDSLHEEWLAVTRRRSRQRFALRLAMAASAVLVFAMAFHGLRTDTAEHVAVAAISKSFGSIYLLGERSELRDLPDISAISAGQTVITGADAGLGLDWAEGGSLRIDANSRIEFLGGSRVFLHSGRVYFDSTGSDLAAAEQGTGAGTLQIDTEHGSVTHLGTRYMTFADESKLSVSVREGRVNIAGRYYDQTAIEGQQVTVSGSARPTVMNFSGYGEAWAWVEATAPPARLDGRSVYEFLSWVSHETGLGLEFDSAAAERLARTEQLRGTVDTEPTNALRLWMMGVDLDWRVEAGMIHVTSSDTGGGP
jgi:ferric-dicitrate binding protein FerR (iron transport regulator)